MPHLWQKNAGVSIEETAAMVGALHDAKKLQAQWRGREAVPC
ncbi:hypothetical protein ACP0HM_01085 [Escherichia coli]